MMHSVVKSVIVCVLIFIIQMNLCFAQQGGDMDDLVEDTKGDFLMVVGGGLGGAILGLSTLSFVDEPKNHTKNIVMGASIGIIAGVIAVAMKQATKSKQMFEGEEATVWNYVPHKDLSTNERIAWHQDQNILNSKNDIILDSDLLNFNYSFSF